MTPHEDALTAAAIVISIICLAPVALVCWMWGRFIKPWEVLFS